MKKTVVLIVAIAIACCPASAFATTTTSKYEKEDLKRQQIIDKKPVCILNEDGKIVSKICTSSPKATGHYPNRDRTEGTILYTKDTETKIAKLVGHAAITVSKRYVVEGASPKVKRGLNNWYRKDHCRAGIIPVLSHKADVKVAKKCKTWIGKKYNWNFWNTSTRAKFYCSHLVYAGYKDVVKYNLNDDGGIVFPSELISDNNVMVVYKKGK